MGVRAATLISLGLIASCNAPRDQTLDGKQLFDQVCARCHAVDGKGDPTAKLQLGVPDMTDPAWQKRLTDADIHRTVHEGSRSKKMPALGDFYNDDQIDAIIKHIRTFSR
jgi:mono/diheme cytochrome c family protein